VSALDDPGRRGLFVVGDPVPWYATAPTSGRERRRRLEDERSRLLARAVGDHLPVELAQRAGDLTLELHAAQEDW
jgi:hypothetical protein